MTYGKRGLIGDTYLVGFTVSPLRDGNNTAVATLHEGCRPRLSQRHPIDCHATDGGRCWRRCRGNIAAGVKRLLLSENVTTVQVVGCTDRVGRESVVTIEVERRAVTQLSFVVDVAVGGLLRQDYCTATCDRRQRDSNHVGRDSHGSGCVTLHGEHRADVGARDRRIVGQTGVDAETLVSSEAVRLQTYEGEVLISSQTRFGLQACNRDCIAVERDGNHGGSLIQNNTCGKLCFTVADNILSLLGAFLLILHQTEKVTT